MEETKTEAKIENMLLPLLEDSDMFVTAIRIKPTNNIKVFLDADSGLNIAKCATINRKLYHIIEESGMYPDGDFSLEVSSPGVDEPLVSIRQYRKNIGRTIGITDMDGAIVTGVLKEADANHVVLGLKGTKKEAPKDVEIAMEMIKTAIVQVTF